jgi:arginase family enzyme
MLGTLAGLAALGAWATTVAAEVDGLYIAIDHDVLDGAEDWSVTMPEADGISLETALAAVRILAASMPVVGYGATAMNFTGGDGPKTVAAAAQLAIAAFG